VTSGRTSATTEALVRVASRIEPEWLIPTRREVCHEFDRDSGSVRATDIAWYDELPLRQHAVAPDESTRASLLATAWRERGPDEASERLIRRLTFAGLAIDLDAALTAAAAEVRRLDEVVLGEDALPWDVRSPLARLAPESLTVPSGRSMRIDYDADGSVSVSVKLQELFGLVETPRIGPGQTPITFSLLAPNGRPVQTTRDLKSFWERTYPEVRKELRGRYPKHPWPDDPWTATPTHRTTKRK
jgi:ATP-dependent helicase HrpB